MIAFFDTGLIRDVFFLAVRLMAALGGFLAGYFLTGPMVLMLARLVTRKPMPQWSVAWCKVLGGIAVAVLVFSLVHIGGWGGMGGGGGGSGGGTGAGKGTGSGKGTATFDGKGFADGSNAVENSGVLVIEMLGPETRKEDKYYLIKGKQPPVNIEGVRDYLKSHPGITGLEIVIDREKSVSRNDPMVTKLQNLAVDCGFERPEPKIVGAKK